MFLYQSKNTWPSRNTEDPASRLEEEAEKKTIALVSQDENKESHLLYQSDNLQKILRITAY